ncbi:hypothetical protein DdX_10127 [Ditylenchus destructor]|uniref:Uncharacterized protein n=1 Tax=Ditylenchus destructor TaxID=166010 RepID=A0AAD4MYP2_9BILA|nr:hypothetical protein DdX_10127 [Ditylenchus destructor]
MVDNKLRLWFYRNDGSKKGYPVYEKGDGAVLSKLRDLDLPEDAPLTDIEKHPDFDQKEYDTEPLYYYYEDSATNRKPVNLEIVEAARLLHVFTYVDGEEVPKRHENETKTYQTGGRFNQGQDETKPKNPYTQRGCWIAERKNGQVRDDATVFEVNPETNGLKNPYKPNWEDQGVQSTIGAIPESSYTTRSRSVTTEKRVSMSGIDTFSPEERSAQKSFRMSARSSMLAVPTSLSARAESSRSRAPSGTGTMSTLKSVREGSETPASPSASKQLSRALSQMSINGPESARDQSRAGPAASSQLSQRRSNFPSVSENRPNTASSASTIRGPAASSMMDTASSRRISTLHVPSAHSTVNSSASVRSNAKSSRASRKPSGIAETGDESEFRGGLIDFDSRPIAQSVASSVGSRKSQSRRAFSRPPSSVTGG